MRLILSFVLGLVGAVYFGYLAHDAWFVIAAEGPSVSRAFGAYPPAYLTWLTEDGADIRRYAIAVSAVIGFAGAALTLVSMRWGAHALLLAGVILAGGFAGQAFLVGGGLEAITALDIAFGGALAVGAFVIAISAYPATRRASG